MDEASEKRRGKLEAELKRIVEALRQRYQPDRILLFGSLVVGQTGPWSDIDLVIVKRTQKRFLQRLKEVALLTQPRVGVDFFVYTPEEFREMTADQGTFQAREMLSRGKVLYERR